KHKKCINQPFKLERVQPTGKNHHKQHNIVCNWQNKKINDLLYQTWPSSLDGEKITMTTNTTIHNNHHVIYKPWHTCRPYDNITFIIIACIFIPIPIPTHNKNGNQKYIGTLLSSQTTRTHNTNHHHNDDQNFAVNETLTPDEHKVKQDQHFFNFVSSEQPVSVGDSL
ncbi:hypothetical protein, partial [Corynebacterium diphtheriae]|uniref:hypothetical protein n=1 Tax=Corynebacterium diphtheriae TaxID=1717 RepID=UPI000AB2C817